MLLEYNQIMKDQLQADVIEKLEQHITEHEAGQVHYLPHRPVILETTDRHQRYEFFMTSV